MSKIIFKYAVAREIEMPEGAQIMTVQEQSDELVIWAMVDQTKPSTIRRFDVIGTGWQISYDIPRSYIGTVQSGAMVWHVFEILNPKPPTP